MTNRQIWRKWTLYCAFGEFIGIGVAGGIAFGVNATIGEPKTIVMKILVLLIMLIAGFFEGLLLGTFQWKALKDKLPSVPQKEWIFYTVLVAVLGWFLGMLPSLFFMPTNVKNNQDLNFNFESPLAFAVLSIITGLILGAVFGLFQWFVLKKYVEKASIWIVANSLGWGLGLGWIYLFASLPNENSNLVVNIIWGFIGGLLAGLSVGSVTGLFLIKLKEKKNNHR
jgi:hypothetical protein